MNHMSENNILTMNLDTEVEHKVFDRILLGLVMKGLTFEIKITGTKVVVYLTGGY
jgi:hypothetical protein